MRIKSFLLLIIALSLQDCTVYRSGLEYDHLMADYSFEILVPPEWQTSHDYHTLCINFEKPSAKLFTLKSIIDDNYSFLDSAQQAFYFSNLKSFLTEVISQGGKFDHVIIDDIEYIRENLPDSFLVLNIKSIEQVTNSQNQIAGYDPNMMTYFYHPVIINEWVIKLTLESSEKVYLDNFLVSNKIEKDIDFYYFKPEKLFSDINYEELELELLWENSNFMASKISPTWQSVDRSYYSNINRKFLKSKKILEANEWEANLQYLDSIEATIKKNQLPFLMFNKALAYELTGQLDSAINITQKLADEYRMPVAIEYVKELKTRKQFLKNLQGL